MEVELKVHTPEHFNAGVKDLLPYMSCLDAILAYCEMNNLEFDTVKRLDAFIVKIKTGKPNTDKHVTEVGFDDSQCDYIIDNSTRDLDQFRKNIDTMIQGRFNVYPSSR